MKPVRLEIVARGEASLSLELGESAPLLARHVWRLLVTSERLCDHRGGIQSLGEAVHRTGDALLRGAPSAAP